MGEGELEGRNINLQKKYSLMKEKEVMYEAIETDDAEIVVVAFGIAARVALSAVQNLRKEGLAVGLFRPVTLFPFPEKQLTDLADNVEMLLVVELNAGQMVEDVKLAVNGKIAVDFYGRMGGGTLTPDEVYDEVRKVHSNMPVKN
jgi:2-oxoglutarate ferredoxin oxidoreductase subunit alpha